MLADPLRNDTEIHRGPLCVWMPASTSSPMLLRYIRSHNIEEVITRKGIFDYQFDWTLEYIIGWSLFTLKWWQTVSSVEKVSAIAQLFQALPTVYLELTMCAKELGHTIQKFEFSNTGSQKLFRTLEIFSNPHMFLQLFWGSIMAPSGSHWQYLLFHLHYPLNNFQLSQYWMGQCCKDSYEVCAEYLKWYPDMIEWSMHL